MSHQSKYSEEFKQEAVKLVLEQGYTIVKACNNLGIAKSTMDNWLRQYRKNKYSHLNETEQTELSRLRKENKELRMERDILKEAAVYFAGESKKGTRS